MERKASEKQIGSCVDPLWDTPFTDGVSTSIRRCSQGSEGTVSRKSTPLTPQEFELLSNSNPFKQDIAEKYGLAYPAITTRSRSRDVLQKARGVYEAGDVVSAGDVRIRQCDVEDFIDSGEEGDYGKATREDSQSVFVALSQFLLRNRQSIDESIQKLDNTDEFISRRCERSEEPSIKSELLDNDSVLEFGDKNSTTNKVVFPKVHGTSGGIDEKCSLDLAETQTVHLNADKNHPIQERSSDIFPQAPRSPKSDTCDLQCKNGTASKTPLSSSSSWSKGGQSAVNLYDSSEDTDPFAAIRNMDMLRKQSVSLSEDDMQRWFTGSSQVTPHSFDTAELSASVSRESCKSVHSSCDPFIEVPEAGGKLQSVSQDQQSPDKQQLSELKTSSDGTLLNFEDSFTDFLTLSNDSALRYEFTDKDESVGPDREAGQALEVLSSPGEIHDIFDDAFATHRAEEVAKDNSVAISPEFYKSVRVQKADSEDADPLNKSFTSPFQELEHEPKVPAKDAQVDSVSEDLPCGIQHGQAAQNEMDVFSSSFYAAFSTTVSSLEDMEDAEPASDAGEKIVSPLTDEDKCEEGKSSGTGDNDNDSVFGSEANENRDGSLEVKDADTWDVFFTPGIEASDLEINSLSECDDPARCISKDILLQKKFKVSDDSAESSRGSVSRESMKVNLSQDSSILDQLEDLPMSASANQQHPETGLHRHFDLVTQLDPLTECTSTDSVMVHCSSDSLHSLPNTQAESSMAQPPHSDLTTVATEKQTRRSSLPVMAKANPGIGEPVLSASQSGDIEEDRPRRSSLPSGVAKDCSASKAADTKESTKHKTSDSFDRNTQNKPLYDKEMVPKATVLKESDKHVKKTDHFANLSNAFPASVSKLVNAISEQVFQATVSSFASASPAAPRTTETSMGATVAKEDQEASVSKANLVDTDNERAESPTFTEFIRSRLQKPLKAISMFAPKTTELTDKKHRPMPTESIFVSGQQSAAPIVTQPGSCVVNTEQQLQPKRADETSASFRDRLLHMRLSKAESPEQPGRSGFLENNTKVGQIVNINIPPDLVPYEETYTESLQSLTEASCDSLALVSETGLNNAAKQEDFSELVEKVDGLPIEVNVDICRKSHEVCIVNSKTRNVVVEKSETDAPEIEESTEEADGELELTDVDKAITPEGGFSAGSSTDSDGGDIDAIVQEFKQETSDSDEADIDDIVMEFKKDNPADDNGSLGGSEDGTHRSTAFNKFSRVLNKVQSVTKYMSKKKGDQSIKDHDEKHRPSIFSLHRRYTESYSRDEGIEDTSPQPQGDKDEHEDALELLSKAADVFKAQTIKKKRATPGSAWRSKTIHTENVVIDDENEYDIVSRAAILFKGFKCKKPGDIDSSLSRSEGEKSTVEITEIGKSIDLSQLQMFAMSNVDAESKTNDQLSMTKLDDLGTTDFQESQVRNMTLELDHGDKNGVVHELLRPSTGSDTLEITDITDILTRGEDHADSDHSKLDDSGFDSINRHIGEPLVLSDAAESPFGDLTEEITEAGDEHEDSLLEPAALIMDREVEQPFAVRETLLGPLDTPIALGVLQKAAAETLPSDDRSEQKSTLHSDGRSEQKSTLHSDDRSEQKFALRSDGISEHKSAPHSDDRSKQKSTLLSDDRSEQKSTLHSDDRSEQTSTLYSDDISEQNSTLYSDDRSEQETIDKKDNEINAIKEDTTNASESCTKKDKEYTIGEMNGDTQNQSNIHEGMTIDNKIDENTRSRESESHADSISDNKIVETKEDKTNQQDTGSSKVMEMALNPVLSNKEAGNEVTAVFTPESCTSDTTAESVSPPASANLNEHTCDLILSTGYDETKAARQADTLAKGESESAEIKSSSSQREKTNGKLEEIAKEISALEAAGLQQATGRSSVETLELRAPEYQRLSSESSEAPDAYSLTVNVPESPDNMKNLDDAASFSLCCGGNFKINLNCTAMVKKPERRPSSVVIKDKRCAMTEEEKMFPLKVSSSYRDGLDSATERADMKVCYEDPIKERAQVKMIQDLKVNEHERNRNFAGSREELLEEASLKQASTEESKSDPQKVLEQEETDLTQDIKEQDSGAGHVAKEREDEVNDSEREKRIVKRKSMIEETGADKKAMNIYESVLGELMQKQTKEDPTKKEPEPPPDVKKTAQSKRFARVISDSDFYGNFGENVEIEQKNKHEEMSQADDTNICDIEPSTEKSAEQVLCSEKPGIEAHPMSRPASNISMQQSIDMYDNVMFPESAPPLPKRSPRQSTTGHRTEDRSNPRYADPARSSFSSVVSDGAAEVYNQARRHHARTKWVSSTPHLSATERPDQTPSNRTSSYPYLPGSEADISSQFPSSKGVSASSLQSDSICWGNYARIEDVQEKRSYDSESSSGLVIPGVGRESTLSDISGAYIFGEYATVKDDVSRAKLLQSADGHNQRNDGFQFRHFPAALDDPHYQNVRIITAQPSGTRYRVIPSQLDVQEDMAPGFENYATIGQPMQSKYVQFSPPTTPVGVIKVHCASQTSSESLAGLVRNDASDILEGLPVFEYTLGATQSTNSLLSDTTDSSPVRRYSDIRQPDLTRQTASLDRRKFRKDLPKKKATKVTFSRDEVLTEVIDGIKKSEGAESNGRGLRSMATSTLSSLGGGVREFARIFHVPFQCCRSGRRGKPKPSEPPILRHSFRLYHFRRPHRCFVCKQLVYNQGSACQVCRYICHRKCELQVMSTCVPQVTADLSNETLSKNQSSSSRLVGVTSQSQSQSAMSSTVRDMLNKSQEQTYIDSSLTLDVVYIIERIISMTFASEGHDATYAHHLKEVVQMLKTKHGDNYLILNLSEKRQDLTKANPQVKEYGWPDHLAPPLERLCSLCKSIDSWLNADIRNVVILHCKGGRSRIACVIAAYMHYSNICASADQALDRFAMKRFYDDKLGGLPLPSQRRYVRYFSGLLSGAIKINSSPLYLHHILIHGVPNFDTKGGCRPFIKVYQGMQPIFTSGVYNVTDNMQKVCISISPGIPLRGDILIKCYHKKTRTGLREVIWQCQFHTCAISDNSLVFSKQELDDAVLDPRFPDNGKVEFVFGPSSDILVSVSGFKSDVTVPVDDNEETLARSDSYENFNRALEAVDAFGNRVSSSSSRGSVSGTYTSQHHVPTIDYNKAPDGSLYAAVSKRGLPPASTPVPQGSVHFTNGSKPSSLDFGYAGQNNYSSHYTSSAVSSNNINNNINIDTVSPSYSAQVHQINQSNANANANRRPVQTLEERTQLDELLSDLLSDQAYVSPTQQSPRSFQTAAQSQKSSVSPSGTSSNIALSPAMSSAKTYNTTSRTYTTYSNADTHRNPDKLLIQHAEVSYKVPGQGEVKDHYTIAADPTDVLDTSSGRPSQTYHPKGVPTNAFSYTTGMSSSQQTSSQQTSSQRAEVVEHEVIRSQPAHGLQSPPSHSSYRSEYEPKFETSQSSYQYSSLDEDTNSWLQQQQQKLKNFKEGRDSSGRTEQEKKLVNELRYAQNKYYTRRDQTEEEERVAMDSQGRQTLHNGPASPERVTTSYTIPQRSQNSTTVDGLWPQDQYYNTSYSTSSYTESRSYGDKKSNKPPPSPTMQRSQPTSSAPMPVPARTSSKDYMRTRSSSGGSSWQQQQPPLPQPRTLQRQQSDTLYDRNRDVEHIQPRSYGSTHSTPPHSPRAVSPSGTHSTTTYTTYRTIDRQRDAQEEMLRAKRAPQQQQAAPPQQLPTQVNHHYITEVFVHRTDLNKDKTDSSTRLDELEKTLEAASQSIQSSQQHIVRQAPQQPLLQQPVLQQPVLQQPVLQQSVLQQSVLQQPVLYQQVPQQQIFEESLQAHSSRQYHTYQESKPEPLRVKEIEEDRIMLRPIGPGVQTLEPETVHTHTGTLGRPTTPGFPTGPGGGSHIISPTGTLQHPVQQQQHQTVQYQHYQTQHHQSQSGHHDGQGQGTLHIDTSPKMFITPQSPPSAGSPPSPGNFNTLRQQLSSAHNMSGSVISPGPHSMTGQSSPSVYFGLSRRGSLSSLTDSEMVHTTPKFVKDMSKYWYKPNISREEAIQMLKDKQPGTFVIRDSNSFPGAFGLALKVATLPPNVQAKPSGDPQADLVRHFLIEPTPKGVRLRGCSNEPVFGSLAALVYQHSITPLALPCKLMLPDADVDGILSPESPVGTTELNSAATLLAQGAACNVVYINSVDMESLTGPQAVAKAVKTTFENLAPGRTTAVHFKVSSQGITLTDNNRKLFFRRHYPVTAVTYCGMDPQDRRWKRDLDAPGTQGDARIFGFVARKQGSANENTCHIFAELDPEQPASAIVNFVTKVMIGQSKVKTSPLPQ